jgi:hypothetical protein
MIGRIAWTAGLLAIAAVTTALQIDRESHTSRALAPLVPPPLRNYAQTKVTLAAIGAGDPQAALAEAQRLVRRRPVPAEYLSLLAIAQAQAGQVEQAELTIQIAGQRGWREPLAQEAVLRLALAAGDTAEAARRYAALFRRQATPDALLIELGPQVLGEPQGAGRKTFIDIIVGAERWHTLFLERGPQVMPQDAFSAITAAAIARGVMFDCDPLKRTVEGLRQRDAAAAQAMAGPATRACP